MLQPLAARPRVRAPQGSFRNRDDRPRLAVPHVVKLTGTLFAAHLHAKRVLSLANGVVGVLFAAGLGIHTIGRALAEASGRTRKHSVKQVDRLLSNDGISLAVLLPQWIQFVVGPRKDIVVALDWTEFEKDDHSTICAYLITRHSRATPLVWKTVRKSTLAGKRFKYEQDLLDLLGRALPEDVHITLLADHGFGDREVYSVLDLRGWDYVIRFREGILVTHDGQTRPARDWVPPSGHAKLLRKCAVTTDKAPVAAVAVKHAKGMKEAWCLVTSLAGKNASEIVGLYAKRFTIEETFRDTKDIHFGMGLSATHIKDTQRRDRLLLLGAMAHALMVLLGEAGERCGLDRTLKTNTAERRQLSLYNQGTFWFRALPNMRPDDRDLLLPTYDAVIREHQVFREAFGVI